MYSWFVISLKELYDYYLLFLDAIASPSAYPCQSVGEWVSESFIVSDFEIAVASPSFAILFESVPLQICAVVIWTHIAWYHKDVKRRSALLNVWWFLYFCFLHLLPQEHSYIVKNVSCTLYLFESWMVNCGPSFCQGPGPLLKTIRGLDWWGLIIYGTTSGRCHMTSSPANWEEQSQILIGFN